MNRTGRCFRFICYLLQPFVYMSLCCFQCRTLRMLLLDIAKEIFDVLPVAFICIYREDLILFRAGSHGFLFALAESQHLGQPVVGLLVQILAITFILPAQYSDFQREHIRESNKCKGPVTWIVKPRAGCCGNGIRLIQNTRKLKRN